MNIQKLTADIRAALPEIKSVNEAMDPAAKLEALKQEIVKQYLATDNLYTRGSQRKEDLEDRLDYGGAMLYGAVGDDRMNVRVDLGMAYGGTTPSANPIGLTGTNVDPSVALKYAKAIQDAVQMHKVLMPLVKEYVALFDQVNGKGKR